MTTGPGDAPHRRDARQQRLESAGQDQRCGHHQRRQRGELCAEGEPGGGRQHVERDAPLRARARLPVEQEQVVDQPHEEHGDDVDHADARLDEGQAVKADEERGAAGEHPVATQPARDQIDESHKETAEQHCARPPGPGVEAPPGHGRRHQQLGQRRLRVEVRFRRLAQVLGRVHGKVDLVEHEPAGVDVAAAVTDRHQAAFAGFERMAHAPVARAPGA